VTLIWHALVESLESLQVCAGLRSPSGSSTTGSARDGFGRLDVDVQGSKNGFVGKLVSWSGFKVNGIAAALGHDEASTHAEPPLPS
jgi:hypothetical protein